MILCLTLNLITVVRDDAIENVRPKRNTLCDLFGVPRPILKVNVSVNDCSYVDSISLERETFRKQSSCYSGLTPASKAATLFPLNGPEIRWLLLRLDSLTFIVSSGDRIGSHTVKTRINEQVLGGFRLILFLYIGCFLQNQPENVLQVFLKLFLEIKYSTD